MENKKFSALGIVIQPKDGPLLLVYRWLPENGYTPKNEEMMSF